MPFRVRIASFFLHADKVCRGVDKRFEEMNETEQDWYFQRLGITGCVALSCIVSGFFYWSLPPIWRVLLVPIFMGLSWWLGATVLPKLLTPDGRKQVVQRLNVVEFRLLLDAVTFTATSFIVAAMPFWIGASQFQLAISNPNARTILLGAFIWNLIGAPLFAQAKTSNARIIIILVFGIPSATVAFWWSLFC